MSKKLSPEEWEKLCQELEELRESLKTSRKKINNYTGIVECSVFWASRQVYLEMLKNFLSRKIDGETLTSKFFKLRSDNIISQRKLCVRIEDNILPIPDLYYTSKAEDFISAIDDLFVAMDEYDPDMDDDDDGWNCNNIVYSENGLRSVIQEIFVPILQKSCDLNDSFFRPQVDLD